LGVALLLDYILKNKEWIFSGIGVTVIVLLGLVFKYLLRKKDVTNRKNVESIQNNSGESDISKIGQAGDMAQEDVYRIIQELEGMPPLHIDDVTKNYIGLNVDWLTEYNSAYKKGGDLIRVFLTLITESNRPINVRCEVKLSEYKQFSILKRNAKVRVIGKIASFDSYDIELSNIKLFFQK
jgi:hypothetical protein